jgi:hypothetical protein
MRLELLQDAREFWPRAEADIRTARERVFVQTLSFEGDSAGQSLARALAASRASEKRVLVDSFTRHVVNDRFLHAPASFYVSEIFKVEGGRIVHIDNIGIVKPGRDHTTGFHASQQPTTHHWQLQRREERLVARWSSPFFSAALADVLVDPLQDQVGDLQAVLVLHDHVAVAAVPGPSPSSEDAAEVGTRGKAHSEGPRLRGARRPPQLSLSGPRR